jgi:hypothetical protein
MEHPFVEPPDETIDDEETERRLRPGTVFLLLLLIAAMLATLAGPVVWQTLHRLNAPPTPTPTFLQAA